MGSHRIVLPESKFFGEEDLREFLRDFEIYVASEPSGNDKGENKQVSVTEA